MPIGNANAVLLDTRSERVLIEAEYPDEADVILDVRGRVGRKANDSKHLVFTHGHFDHMDSAAVIVQATRARIYLHAADVPPRKPGIRHGSS